MASIIAGSKKPKNMGSPQQIIASADLQPLSSNLKVLFIRELVFTFCFFARCSFKPYQKNDKS